MSSTKHSPTPYRAEYERTNMDSCEHEEGEWTITPLGAIVGFMAKYDDREKLQAEIDSIVTACNAHDGLLAEVEKARRDAFVEVTNAVERILGNGNKIFPKDKGHYRNRLVLLLRWLEEKTNGKKQTEAGCQSWARTICSPSGTSEALRRSTESSQDSRT